MGATSSSLPVPVACAPCKGDLPCTAFGDGPIEDLDADSPAADGDVRDSQAMTNHKLLKAAREGHVENIHKMLERGAFIETRRPFVMTPESAATSDSSLQTRGTGLTPLMYAAQGGYERACEALLAEGACVNAEDEDGMRPLHFAAFSGSSETCSILLSSGADLTALDDEGRRAIEHVTPGDATTPAERRSWENLLQSPWPSKVGSRLGA